MRTYPLFQIAIRLAGRTTAPALLSLALLATPMAHARGPFVLAYPVAPYDSLSRSYTLRVDRTSVPVAEYYGGRYSYSYLAFEGKTRFALTVASGARIISYNISPHAFGITGNVSGSQLTFSVKQHRSTYLIIDVTTEAGPLEPMVIAGDPRETHIPKVGAGVYDITASPYGADNSGQTLLNATIQRAIDDVSAKGGGTLYFPPGVYQISNNIRLASNITIYLQAGAFLHGSSHREDYVWNAARPTQGGQPQQGPQNFVVPGGVQHVAFTGRGVIDANSTVLATAASPGKPIDGFGNYRKGIIHSNADNGKGQPDGITLTGITLRDATTWTLNIKDALNVTIQNVKMLNDFQWIHSDGYDIVSTRNALIDNCLGVTGDDVFDAKASDGNPLENVTYSNDVGYSFKGTGTKVGVQAEGTANHIVFTNIQIVAGQRAVSVSHDAGSAGWQDLRFEHIHMENIEGTAHSGQFLVAPIVIWTLGGGAGPVSNVVVSDVTVDHSNGFMSQIKGANAAGSVSGVELHDVTIDGIRITERNASSKILVGPNVSDLKFDSRSVSGTP